MRRPGPGRAGPGQVDIRDLSWEDKERVLRLLFAKINQSQGAVPAAAVGAAALASVVRPAVREGLPSLFCGVGNGWGMGSWEIGAGLGRLSTQRSGGNPGSGRGTLGPQARGLRSPRA